MDVQEFRGFNMRSVTFKVSPFQNVAYDIHTTALYCEQANQAFKITLEGNQQKLPMDKAFGYSSPPDPSTGLTRAFRKLEVFNDLATELTALVLLGEGQVIDNRVSFVSGSSALEVQNVAGQTLAVSGPGGAALSVWQSAILPSAADNLAVTIAPLALDQVVAAAGTTARAERVVHNVGIVPVHVYCSHLGGGSPAGGVILLPGDEYNTRGRAQIFASNRSPVYPAMLKVRS